MAFHRRLLRWAFHRLYREFAWTYDGVAWLVSAGLWRAWGLAALPELRGRVLELGPGPGHLQFALAARDAAPPLGLDASPQMAARASRRLRAAGFAPRIARGLAQSIPFPAASVDTVVATFPAEYILDPRCHAEIRRVLVPGGQLVIVDGGQLGASPPFAPAAPLRLTIPGFDLSARWVAVGPSRVLVIVGERDAADA